MHLIIACGFRTPWHDSFEVIPGSTQQNDTLRYQFLSSCINCRHMNQGQWISKYKAHVYFHHHTRLHDDCKVAQQIPERILYRKSAVALTRYLRVRGVCWGEMYWTVPEVGVVRHRGQGWKPPVMGEGTLGERYGILIIHMSSILGHPLLSRDPGRQGQRPEGRYEAWERYEGRVLYCTVQYRGRVRGDGELQGTLHGLCPFCRFLYFSLEKWRAS